jgi:phosphohistidine phosphatase
VALAAALAKRGMHFDQVVTSPLLRARQTAEALLKQGPSPVPPLHLCDYLAPGGKRRKLTRFLRGLEGTSLALIGHMPDLALYAAWLIGSKKVQIDIAKAGVVCIRFEGRPDKSQGTLTGLVTPPWYD